MKIAQNNDIYCKVKLFNANICNNNEILLKLPIFSIIVSRMIALCTAIFFGCIMHRLKILF